MTNLKDLSPEERQAVLKILKEYSNSGTSSMYNSILLEDYREIPVDIKTFLHDKNYLGRALIDAEGRYSLFQYWEDLLTKIYPDPLKPATCNTLALTGAIGIGKSTEAVIIGLYELYRMMCLKNPSVYYGIMSTDTISFAVINITLDASRGVAWDKLQSMAQASDWFVSHGYMKGTVKPEWFPNPEYKLDLICGSQPRHFIGKALYWCLDPDTIIKTTEGDKRLGDLTDKVINVFTVDDDGNVTVSDDCTVKPTECTNEEYQIELEDGTIIKCTPTHRFMLKDGTYKEAQYLTEDDELFDIVESGEQGSN